MDFLRSNSSLGVLPAVDAILSERFPTVPIPYKLSLKALINYFQLTASLYVRLKQITVSPAFTTMAMAIVECIPIELFGPTESTQNYIYW